MGVSDRWVRVLLKRMSKHDDAVMVPGLRGCPSNRSLAAETQRQALAILKQREWYDFGPTFAAEQLANRPILRVGRLYVRVATSASLESGGPSRRAPPYFGPCFWSTIVTRTFGHPVLFAPMMFTSIWPLAPAKLPMPPTTAIGPLSGCGPIATIVRPSFSM